MNQNKLTFLLSTRQFIKQIQIHRPECLGKKGKEREITNNFKKLEPFIGTIENLILEHVIERDGFELLTFQTFLKCVCYKLHLPCIELKNLDDTCNDPEKQMILLLSIYYYFVN